METVDFDIETFKMHIGVTSNREDNLIKEYARWSEDFILDRAGIKEEHLVDFRKDRNFTKIMWLLTAHFYENRVPFDRFKSEPMEYSVGQSIYALSTRYERWLRENEN